MADPEGRRNFEEADAYVTSRNKQLEANRWKTPPILNSPHNFHVANIQNIIAKTLDGNNCKYIKENEKIEFLKELCEEEKPFFMAFAETCLKEEVKVAEFDIKGYSHVASHRKNRNGGGVIIYLNNNLTYQTLVSISDEMCSVVAIHINELNTVVFMVYRPPPNNKNKYHGEILAESFKKIVIDNKNK